MTKERLGNLALLSIEKQELNKADFSTLIENFATQKSQKTFCQKNLQTNAVSWTCDVGRQLARN